jgi:hypothetical protein
MKKRVHRAAHPGGIRGPRCYRDADFRTLFERCGLEVVLAFDEPVVGMGVRYYILKKAGEKREG